MFVLPSAVLLWGLSWIYAAYGRVPRIAAIFYGLKPAVTALVTVALIRIGRRALKNALLWGVAAAAFAAMQRFKVGVIPVVLASGVLGLAWHWVR